tara:strand:+ start:87 stop:830 length:744 start_codon:yes stop_codon:yes gene_type:complete
MIYTITNGGLANGRPSSIGSNSIDVDNRVEYSFTIENFTTETSPPYSDPEDDDMSYIKILTLPVLGTIRLNGSLVLAGQIIQAGSLSTGNLKYICSDQDLGYSESFSFDVADTGSQTISGLQTGVMTINARDVVNLPPDVVGDNNIGIEFDEIFAFTAADFTTNTTPPYNDPEGDAPSKLKILSLPIPEKGILFFNGLEVQVNQVIDFSQVQYLNYAPVLLQTQETLAKTASFRFSISDEGSGLFTE